MPQADITSTKSSPGLPRFGLRRFFAVCFFVCLLLAVVFQGLPAVIDYVGEYAVAVHQRSVTQSLAEWGDEYSQIATRQDADRAMEMIEYIKSYYVPSEGYRADSETEARLESQRQKTMDQLRSAINEWKSRSQD